jgi:hypothetical protein
VGSFAVFFSYALLPTYVTLRGALIYRAFAVCHQGTCIAIHQNSNFGSFFTFSKNTLMIPKATLGTVDLPGGYSKEDKENLNANNEFSAMETGYSSIQCTRPQV